MPAHFVSAFTPIDVAGTDGQIKHVSRLLAAQVTAHQLGPEAALQIGRVSILDVLLTFIFVLFILHPETD